MIFVAHDVGKDGVTFTFERPIAIPGDRRASGNASIHQRQREPQTVAIEDEPFDSVISETTRIVYGNDSFAGEHRADRAPCEFAVADHDGPGTAAGSVHPPSMAGSCNAA